MTEVDDNSQEIYDVSNWCDRWCEKCSQTGHCSLFKATSSVSLEEILESLPEFFETAKKMVEEMLEKRSVDPDSLKRSDFNDDFEWRLHLIRNDEALVLAKQYRKKVTGWFKSLHVDYGMEVRMQDTKLSDCLDVIAWYHALFEMKMAKALILKKEEEEEHKVPYDSLGNAKLLLISVERNIESWTYVYQKFMENEDEILHLLIALQKLGKIVEQSFPDARTFIRPGLDE